MLHRDQRFLSLHAAAMAQDPAVLRPADLVSVLGSYARLRFPPEPAFLEATEAALGVGGGLRGASPARISTLCQALSRLKRAPGPELRAALIASSREALDDFGPRDLAILLHFCKDFGLFPEPGEPNWLLEIDSQLGSPGSGKSPKYLQKCRRIARSRGPKSSKASRELAMRAARSSGPGARRPRPGRPPWLPGRQAQAGIAGGHMSPERKRGPPGGAPQGPGPLPLHGEIRSADLGGALPACVRRHTAGGPSAQGGRAPRRRARA